MRKDCGGRKGGQKSNETFPSRFRPKSARKNQGGLGGGLHGKNYLHRRRNWGRVLKYLRRSTGGERSTDARISELGKQVVRGEEMRHKSEMNVRREKKGGEPRAKNQSVPWARKDRRNPQGKKKNT